MLEKYFIFNRKIGGSDAAFSLEPEEMKQLVQNVRHAERALGKATY